MPYFCLTVNKGCVGEDVCGDPLVCPHALDPSIIKDEGQRLRVSQPTILWPNAIYFAIEDSDSAQISYTDPQRGKSDGADLFTLVNQTGTTGYDLPESWRAKKSVLFGARTSEERKVYARRGK